MTADERESSPSWRPVRVHLADGSAAMRMGLALLLVDRKGISVAGESGDLRAMLRALGRAPADVLVANVLLLGPALRRLPTVRHLVRDGSATGHEHHEGFARHALASGASLYLPVDRLVDELPGAIHSLAVAA